MDIRFAFSELKYKFNCSRSGRRRQRNDSVAQISFVPPRQSRPPLCSASSARMEWRQWRWVCDFRKAVDAGSCRPSLDRNSIAALHPAAICLMVLQRGSAAHSRPPRAALPSGEYLKIRIREPARSDLAAAVATGRSRRRSRAVPYGLRLCSSTASGRSTLLIR